jgi:phosphohistidine phosphatase
MKTLLLLRHAKSSWDDASLDDHDRPLSDRGGRAGRLVASYLARQSIGVELVLCSSALRARQTLDLVLPSLEENVEVRIEDGLYAADATDLLDRLRGVAESVPAVLVVGHNPSLQQLALRLVAGGEPARLHQLQQKFPTGAVATITTETTWARLGPGVGYLKSLVMPRALERS